MTTTFRIQNSPLTFYLSEDEQAHRRSYAFGEVFPLYGSTTMLLPFQFVMPHDGSSFSVLSRDIESKDGSVRKRLQLTRAGLKIIQYPSYGIDVVTFPGNIPMLTGLKEGQYYINISTSNQQGAYRDYRSDIITLVNDLTPYLKVEWWDTEDLITDSTIIAYRDQYHNVVYLPTELGKPEYTFEEEGESRDGYFFPLKRISNKTYKATFVANEQMLDALRIARLSDFVRVTDQFGNVYMCDTLTITPEWKKRGSWASVEMEFTSNTVVKKIGSGYVENSKGDFNDDFNNDFKITT